MQADLPADATEDDQLSSALIHEAIPPWFARLDDPDDNVVTKVMALDVDTNKFDLLVSLGRVAQQDDFTDVDLETMKQTLDNLADIEDVDGVDQYLEQNLL